MKLQRLKYVFLLSTVTAILLSACIKDDVKELGDAGKTFLKILEAPEQQFFFEPFSETRNVTLFSVRRDANSNAALNQPVTINLRLDTAAITAYNTANHTSYERLPDSLFTLAGSGVTKTGDLTYQIALQPGEFAKDFTIALNGTKWDLAHVYSAPFVITDAGGLTLSSDKDQINTFISIKNAYDGAYSLKFAFYHPTASSDYGTATEPVELHTSGPNSVKVYMPRFGGFYHPILSGGAITAFGAQEPELTIDPVTNKVTVQNSYAGAVTFYSMASGYDSRYDPATKTFYLKFGYNYANGSFDAANTREWTDTLTYVGPR
ncbi:MAG TPA: DUF1735 domain-containing protein [Flavisolibacter sp.]|jgi:hypothetical protein|nr:DUF1735 domain-containing protein [Flavisolibacter sp.]